MSNIANDNVFVQGNFSSKKSSNGGSNSGGGDMTLETRVGNLEADMKDVKKSLQGIEVTLARIEGDLKTKASKEDLLKSEGELKEKIGRVEGKVDGLPKWNQLFLIGGFIGVVSALLIYVLPFILKLK